MIDSIKKASGWIYRRYRKHKLEYELWQLRPKLFGAIAIIALLAATISFAQGASETFDRQNQWKAIDSVAQAFEQAPDLMLSTLENNKANLSSYEYALQYEKYRFFARNAPSIAERIRSDNGFAKLLEGGWIVGKQVLQTIGGKLIGKGTGYIGKHAGPGMLEKGIELTSKGYTSAGRILSRGGLRAFAMGKEIGDASSNLAFEITVLATNTDPPPSPELQRALASPEMKELFDLLRKATEQDPDKLMTAALHQAINTVGLERDRELYPDEEYRTAVMNVAKNLIMMTKEGGSSTSMWSNVEELAKWLAEKAGRTLPDPEPEITQTTVTDSADTFVISGEFSSLEELGYEIGHWNYNTIRIVVKNGQIIEAESSGELIHEVETSALHTYDKHKFTFSGTFNKSPEGSNSLGTFKNCVVIHTKEYYSSVTGDKGTYTERYSFSGTLKLDGTIEGTMTGWPNKFKLVKE